jgi:type I restriction enzyme S subunit
VSHIDNLIAVLCPVGVEFRAIEDCVVRPEVIRWSQHLGEEFQYIDLTSVNRITHTIADTASITSDTAPSRAQQIVRAGDVIFGTTRPTLQRYAVVPADLDGQICSTGFCVLRPNSQVVLTNYLFHLLGSRAFYTYVGANERGGSYPAISDSLLKRYRLPVPPLEVQSEVCGVLDAFAKLGAELEAELGARRQQYGHYRDSLLDFSERESVSWVTFGEVATIVRGGSPRPIQAYLTDAEDGVNWIKIGDVASGGKYITSTA